MQNFPKFFCRLAFIRRNDVCVAHRGLRFGMSQAIQPHRHRRIDLIKQRGIAVSESMKAALLDAQLLQERMKLPLAYQAVIHGVPFEVAKSKRCAFGLHVRKYVRK